MRPPTARWTSLWTDSSADWKAAKFVRALAGSTSWRAGINWALHSRNTLRRSRRCRFAGRPAPACFCEYRRERFVEHDDGFSVWDRDGALIHEADPNRVTPACAEQERYNRAVFDRIAQRPGSEA